MDYLSTAPRWQRKDGNPHHRPGLVDENLRPKVDYSAVVDALQKVCHG
jgi:hypothetical protein